MQPAVGRGDFQLFSSPTHCTFPESVLSTLLPFPAQVPGRYTHCFLQIRVLLLRPEGKLRAAVKETLKTKCYDLSSIITVIIITVIIVVLVTVIIIISITIIIIPFLFYYYSGYRILRLARAIFSAPVRIGPGAYSASCTIRTGFLSPG
jgi:hypothetical protein